MALAIVVIYSHEVAINLLHHKKKKKKRNLFLRENENFL